MLSAARRLWYCACSPARSRSRSIAWRASSLAWPATMRVCSLATPATSPAADFACWVASPMGDLPWAGL
ncbi:hypothetical protein Pve01_68170 [Planomonospora venezuelensis]|nr:hypothetical protein Pve01_68170 [Planomonospora venezuelensis]